MALWSNVIALSYIVFPADFVEGYRVDILVEDERE